MLLVSVYVVFRLCRFVLLNVGLSGLLVVVVIVWRVLFCLVMVDWLIRS